MTITAIREKLHGYIDVADDKKVEAIYTMVEDEIMENLDLWKDQEFLDELDRRMYELESGKVKGISLDEFKANY